MSDDILLDLTTELEAVNAILASVGESPVASLDDPFDDAGRALAMLRQVARAVQTKAWIFNTELEFVLAPDNSGTIYIPRNTLKLRLEDKNIVRRGLRLYDRLNRTYTFSAPITALELVVLLPFAEMPESLRRYATIKAGRHFQDQYGGDQIIHQFQQSDELRAWADALNDEGEEAEWNVLSNSLLVARLKGNR